jgi:hypothetical protein
MKSVIEKYPCGEEVDSAIISAGIDLGTSAVFNRPYSCTAPHQGDLMLPFASFVPYLDAITARSFDHPAIAVIGDLSDGTETPSTCSRQHSEEWMRIYKSGDLKRSPLRTVMIWILEYDGNERTNSKKALMMT